MSDQMHTTTGISKVWGGRRIVPVVAISIAVMVGCGVPVDAGDEGASAKGGARTEQASASAGLDPALSEPALEGTVRKVGATWYEFTDGGWSQQARSGRTVQAQDPACGDITRKCFLPTASPQSGDTVQAQDPACGDTTRKCFLPTAP